MYLCLFLNVSPMVLPVFGIHIFKSKTKKSGPSVLGRETWALSCLPQPQSGSLPGPHCAENKQSAPLISMLNRASQWFYFKILLATWDSLQFHVNYRIFSIYTKKGSWAIVNRLDNSLLSQTSGVQRAFLWARFKILLLAYFTKQPCDQ